MLSLTPSVRGPQERGALREFRNCTPHNTQFCTHRPGVMCVQANTCPCQANNCLCTSGFPSEIVATRALRGPLLHQVSRTTWVKTSRRPKKPPQPSVRPSPRSSFTQTHRCYHPASSREDPMGLPYRRAPTLTKRPQRSPIPPPSNLPHRWHSGE